MEHNLYWILLASVCVISFFVGSIPFAVIVSKLMGLADPRSYGSQNPGATNVLRSGNKLAAAWTLLGDCAKGLVVVLVARALGFDLPVVMSMALAVFFGHVFSVFLRFKGGKGVATALGVLLGLSPWLGGAVLLTWVLVFGLFRYSSLAALTAAVLAPVYAGLLINWTVAMWLVVVSAMLVWRHQSNIKKLCRGEEGKFGQKSSSK
jgi:glycerol-3-phosphate acyltransferase PlsY